MNHRRHIALLAWFLVCCLSLAVSAGWSSDLTDPDMAADGAATASSEFDVQTDDKAFDDVIGTFANCWSPNDTVGNGHVEWIQYDFGFSTSTAKETIRRYRIHTGPSDSDYMPDDWTFSGSNDGSSWTTLDTRADAGLTINAWSPYYEIANTTAYRYYRLVISDTSSGANFVEVGEIEMMEWVEAYTISGTVTDGTAPIESATITFSHDGHTEATATDGSYAYAVPPGTTTTVTPSHDGYAAWNPASRTITAIAEDKDNQDFEGTINTYEISGTVTQGGSPVQGVTITFSHNGHSEPTALDGTYAYTVNYGITTTITPSHDDFASWTPASRTVTAIAADTPSQDFAGTLKTPEIDVQGNGQSIPNENAVPTSADHTDFGNADIATATVTRTFTIHNTGSATLNLATTVPRVALSGPEATDFELKTNPTATVAAGANTTFQIEFDPSAAGLCEATVSIANDDADENPYTFAILGTGTVAPEIDVQGNTDFGDVPIREGTAIRIFTIFNTGSGPLSLDGAPRVALSGAATDDFNVDIQPADEVAATNGSTTFQISFDPSVAGIRSATVSIANDDADEDPYTFTIQGTGTTPEIDLTGNTDFGAADIRFDTVTRIFSISNTGTAELNLTGGAPYVSISGLHAGDFSLSDPPVTPIGIGTAETFEITFDPSAVGQRTATLSIANDDADEDPYTLAIQGTGTAAPEIDVQGAGQSIPDESATASIDNDTEFGALDILAAPHVHTFTVVNLGSAALEITATTVAPASFSIATTPNASLPPDGTTTFEIAFDPTAIGPVAGTVTIISNDADETPYTFTVSGTGAASPEIDVQGNGLSIPSGSQLPQLADDTDFGSIELGTGSITQPFTIENLGSGDLALTGVPDRVTIDNPAFTVSAQPASPITAGNTITFDIIFAPAAVGTVTATVSMANSDADENPYTFQIRGSATQRPSGGDGTVPTRAPSATTKAASEITPTSAILHAEVNANLSATTVSFLCGLDTEHADSLSAAPSTVTGTYFTPVSCVVTGLTPSTTYHFCVVARSAEGETFGADTTFTTPGWPVGDLNGDGLFDLIDVYLCAMIASGEMAGNVAERSQGDVDGDGDIDMIDVEILSEVILGIRDAFPGEE